MNEEVKGRCSGCGVELPITAYSAKNIGVEGRYCGGCILSVVLGHAAKKVEARRDWISVDERLPQEGVGNHRCSSTVLVSYSIGGGRQRMTTGYYQLDTRAWFLDRPTMHEPVVTHWQPLPEPPPIEQKRKMGQCGDCHYWHIAESLGDIPCDWGECNAPSDALRVHTYLQAPGMSQGVRTRVTTSYWGCIQFEPRAGDA